MCPLHVQRLIVLLLQRRAKEFQLTCGGLFIASFECFATVNNNKRSKKYITLEITNSAVKNYFQTLQLAKATMSYFTLIHSTR